MYVPYKIKDYMYMYLRQIAITNACMDISTHIHHMRAFMYMYMYTENTKDQPGGVYSSIAN